MYYKTYFKMNLKHKIRSFRQIRKEIGRKIQDYTGIKTIPESIDFSFDNFDKLYKEITTKIDVCQLSISSSCVLFGFNSSTELTQEYHNADWSKNEYNVKIKNYWFFGSYNNYFFIMDKNGKISCCAKHFDKNLEKYVLDYFADLNINFKQWLQFAYMDRDNDDIEEVINGDFYDPSYEENDLEENLENYKNKLFKISKELSDFYLKDYCDDNIVTIRDTFFYSTLKGS